MARDNGGRHRTRWDHGTDRNVDLARDHQKADGQGNNTYPRGVVHPACSTEKLVQLDTGKNVEHQNTDQTDDGCGSGAA